MSDDYWQRMVERHPKECAGFDKWRDFLHLREFGWAVPAFKRLQKATLDLREFRRVFSQRGGDYEELTLAVRLVADTFASEIGAAADENQDAATVAWVVAGLRCPMRPFCTGCQTCQTITSPNREGVP